MATLVTKAWLSFAVVAIVMGLLLFVPAGTVRYWQAWVYLAVFIGASVLTTRDLIRRDPALLQRRLKGGPMAESRPAQKLITLATSLGFIGLLVVPALDFRLGWSAAPVVVALIGDALVGIGFHLIARVYRENTFTSATIEVAHEQRVISTGPYAIVRHPMYASASLYLAVRLERLERRGVTDRALELARGKPSSRSLAAAAGPINVTSTPGGASQPARRGDERLAQTRQRQPDHLRKRRLPSPQSAVRCTLLKGAR